jgi:hypothetical protein
MLPTRQTPDIFLALAKENPTGTPTRPPIMSLLCWIATATQYDRSNTSHVINTVSTVVMLLALLLAIYLAIRDLGFLQNTSTKIAVLALAIIYPDLYILLHWISTASAGVGFLSGSPVTPLQTPYTPFGHFSATAGAQPSSGVASSSGPLMMPPSSSSASSSTFEGL